MATEETEKKKKKSRKQKEKLVLLTKEKSVSARAQEGKFVDIQICPSCKSAESREFAQ
jgi:ribosomal protein L17